MINFWITIMEVYNNSENTDYELLLETYNFSSTVDEVDLKNKF